MHDKMLRSAKRSREALAVHSTDPRVLGSSQDLGVRGPLRVDFDTKSIQEHIWNLTARQQSLYKRIGVLEAQMKEQNDTNADLEHRNTILKEDIKLLRGDVKKCVSTTETSGHEKLNQEGVHTKQHTGSFLLNLTIMS